MTTSGTTSNNKWYNEWKRVTSNDNEWPEVVISAKFPCFRIREQLTTKHLKENILNLEEDLAEGLLNWEEEQCPKKKY